jgi:hypothetical protein
MGRSETAIELELAKRFTAIRCSKIVGWPPKLRRPEFPRFIISAVSVGPFDKFVAATRQPPVGQRSVTDIAHTGPDVDVCFSVPDGDFVTEC